MTEQTGAADGSLRDRLVEALAQTDDICGMDHGFTDPCIEPQPDRVIDAVLATLTASGYCPHCGRGDCAPTADDYEAMRQRAEKAEAAEARWRTGHETAEAQLVHERRTIDRVRQLHTRVQPESGSPAYCTHCVECEDRAPWPCDTIRALDGSQP